ncbi:MAG: nucleotide pyrophosphohydrolase [Bacteroidota bacterium]|jgi:NTP pyrophosphatase (non-canonical NTP hydrolase)|nr:nucleotide pyrophosphohydrolase [Ignavibacteria bacterium]MCU7500692.1 nucleotide pyrophosphohydrolase [Ignavibacteria bacterium]MCU7511809.1 nucleotide pyrophosphohydrolase [Ignavibacteria bacterium]MCU7520711.1 nucleotide pyrophosphohydrolase [Ignavibacteria bacterium]
MNELKKLLTDFREERDWVKFHSPKNLSMALSVEASELLELFQWMTEEESLNLDAVKLKRAEEEIGDIMAYLIFICDRLNLDPVEAAKRKMKINKAKYPVELSRGNAIKYNERG